MTVYTKREILKLIKKNILKIEPFNEKLVGETSVDFTLGEEIRVFVKSKDAIDPSKSYKEYTKLVKIKNSYTIKPREFIHGVTHESVELPDNICAWIQGKSSLARLGLMVHITASLMHPGSKGRQVLEIVNLSPKPIILRPHMPICQIVFEDVHGRESYTGEFWGQKEP